MTRTIQALAVSLTVVLLAGAAPGQAARIKCWKNDEGFRECGNSVPPKYAQQGHEERSEGGFTVKKQRKARDKAEVETERQAKLDAEKEAREKKRLQRLRAAKDRVLLDTYVTEQDMDLAHQQKTIAIEQRVIHSRGHSKKLEETLGKMQTQAGNEERAGNEVPKKLKADIGDIQRQIDETEAFITARTAEEKTFDDQHADDLARFRFLKNGGAIGSLLQKK